MCSEPMAQEAKGHIIGLLTESFIGHEGKRNNNNNYCFSKIQQVGQKNIETKHLSPVKA